MIRKKIALFGSGPACLIAALLLSEKHEIAIYEKGKTIARKFLVAGKGGFNLTNEATGDDLLKHYSNDPILHKALCDFDSNATRKWLQSLGIKTFVGSSGRVFPIKGIKPAEVLAKIKDKLLENGVVFHLNHCFIGFSDDAKPLVINESKIHQKIKTCPPKQEEKEMITADHYIFGLGGGSWAITGSDGTWIDAFKDIGIKTSPFIASNCGVETMWDASFIEKFEGTPLKNIAITCSNKTIKGEAVLTANGIEGNAIYPIVPKIRKSIEKSNSAILFIDFKPNNTVEELILKVKGKNIKAKNYAYIFNCPKVTLQMVKNSLSKEAYLDPVLFAKQLKKLPLKINSLRPIEEAISTVGGIIMTEINSNFSLKKHLKISCIGEMLDWDAPTGGFLLQACFSTGNTVAKEILNN